MKIPPPPPIPAPPGPKYEVHRLGTVAEVVSLVEGLKTALLASRTTGAIHSAFGHTVSGRVLQIEVAIVAERGAK